MTVALFHLQQLFLKHQIIVNIEKDYAIAIFLISKINKQNYLLSKFVTVTDGHQNVIGYDTENSSTNIECQSYILHIYQLILVHIFYLELWIYR